MGFVTLNCPSCGAEIQLDSGRDFGFCTYCGTKVVQEKIIYEHRGTVQVSGMASEQSLLERAYLFIEQEDFNEAHSYLEKVLDINPHNAKAYAGEILCQLQAKSLKEAAEGHIPLEESEHYEYMMRFASEEAKKKIEALNQKSVANYKQYVADLNAQLEEHTELAALFSGENARVERQQRLMDMFMKSSLYVAGFSLVAAVATKGDSTLGMAIFFIIAVLFGCVALVLFFTKGKKDKFRDKAHDDYWVEAGAIEGIKKKITDLNEQIKSIKGKE